MKNSGRYLHSKNMFKKSLSAIDRQLNEMNAGDAVLAPAF